MYFHGRLFASVLDMPSTQADTKLQLALPHRSRTVVEDNGERRVRRPNVNAVLVFFAFMSRLLPAFWAWDSRLPMLLARVPAVPSG